MGTGRWVWAAQGRYPGYCLTFVRDREPATVAATLGGGDLRLLTVEETARVHPEAESVLRCGTVPGWAFCYEERLPVAFRPSLVERLSAGTELVQVFRGGDGMTIARRLVDGRRAEEFEPFPGARSRGDGPPVLQSRVERLLNGHDGMLGLIAALCAVGDHVGTDLDRDVLDGPLLTTVTTVVEQPAAAPAGPVGRAGLGRCLGTLTPPPARAGRQPGPGQG